MTPTAGDPELVAAVIDELDNPTTGWQPDAPCLGLTHAFYPEKGHNFALKALCATCPHRIPCLTVAVANFDRYGVWGGYGDKPRRAITRDVRNARPDLLIPRAATAECGTNSGYYRHRDDNEAPCGACTTAHNGAERRRRQAAARRNAA